MAAPCESSRSLPREVGGAGGADCIALNGIVVVCIERRGSELERQELEVNTRVMGMKRAPACIHIYTDRHAGSKEWRGGGSSGMISSAEKL